jgi:myo-inositol-1(or 4)-monophosphatase
MEKPSTVLHVAEEAARAAGAITLRKFGELSHREIHPKEFRDFVTETDKACEAEIGRIIKAAFPRDGMLCEEGTTAPPLSGRTWIVDPLDGTLNFIHSFPVFSISIALKDEAEGLTLGVVYQPVQDELFTAEKGRGAYLNGHRISVADRREDDGWLIATGLPFKEYHYMDAYMAMLKDVVKVSAGIRRAGSAAIDLAYTACGRFDAFWEYVLLPWDFSAGVLLVREAGGTVTDFTGDDDVFRRRSIIAGNPETHPLLLSMARKHFPKAE